jgi:hypothetical protein
MVLEDWPARKDHVAYQDFVAHQDQLDLKVIKALGAQEDTMQVL